MDDNFKRELKNIRNKKYMMLELKTASQNIGAYMVSSGIAMTKYDIFILPFLAIILVIYLRKKVYEDWSPQKFYALNSTALWIINILITFLLLKLSAAKTGILAIDALFYSTLIVYVFVPQVNLRISSAVSKLFFKTETRPKSSCGWVMYLMSCSLYIPYTTKDFRGVVLMSCFVFGISALVNFFTAKNEYILSVAISCMLSVLMFSVFYNFLEFSWWMFIVTGVILILLSLFVFFRKLECYKKKEIDLVSKTKKAGDKE